MQMKLIVTVGLKNYTWPNYTLRASLLNASLRCWSFLFLPSTWPHLQGNSQGLLWKWGEGDRMTNEKKKSHFLVYFNLGFSCPRPGLGMDPKPHACSTSSDLCYRFFSLLYNSLFFSFLLSPSLSVSLSHASLCISLSISVSLWCVCWGDMCMYVYTCVQIEATGYPVCMYTCV